MAVRHVTRYVRGRFTSKPLRDLLSALDGLDFDFDVSIRRHSRRPPSTLHGYYRGVLIPAIVEAMNEAGCETEQGGPIHEEWVHIHLKSLFLFETRWNEERGGYIRYILSTADLNMEQFGKYVTRVERYGIVEWGIRIDDPEWMQAPDQAAAMRSYFGA